MAAASCGLKYLVIWTAVLAPSPPPGVPPPSGDCAGRPACPALPAPPPGATSRPPRSAAGAPRPPVAAGAPRPPVAAGLPRPPVAAGAGAFVRFPCSSFSFTVPLDAPHPMVGTLLSNRSYLSASPCVYGLSARQREERCCALYRCCALHTAQCTYAAWCAEHSSASGPRSAVARLMRRWELRRAMLSGAVNRVRPGWRLVYSVHAPCVLRRPAERRRA